MANPAINIAAAGPHNLLMIGPPGSGEPGDVRRRHVDDPTTSTVLRWSDVGRTDGPRAVPPYAPTEELAHP